MGNDFFSILAMTPYSGPPPGTMDEHGGTTSA